METQQKDIQLLRINKLPSVDISGQQLRSYDMLVATAAASYKLNLNDLVNSTYEDSRYIDILTKVNKNTENISKLSADLSTTIGTVTSLENTVNGMKENVDKIPTIETILSGQTDKIEQLETRIQTNESEIEKLKSDKFTDAPQDGNLYGRKNGDWEQIITGGGGGTIDPTAMRGVYNAGIINEKIESLSEFVNVEKTETQQENDYTFNTFKIGVKMCDNNNDGLASKSFIDSKLSWQTMK